MFTAVSSVSGLEYRVAALEPAVHQPDQGFMYERRGPNRQSKAPINMLWVQDADSLTR